MECNAPRAGGENRDVTKRTRPAAAPGENSTAAAGFLAASCHA